MSLWPSWLKVSGSSSTSYAALEQTEQDGLPTTTSQAMAPAATKIGRPFGGRRSWHRLLLAVVLVLAALYIVQSGLIFGGPADTAADPSTKATDEPPTNPYAHEFADTLPQDTTDDLIDHKIYASPSISSSTSSSTSSAVASSTSAASTNASTDQTTTPQKGARKLRLLLPATRIDKHLCKAIFTATTMGFPQPVLINWGMKPAKGDYAVSHLAKVGGIKNYLESLGPEASDDLVVIADALDLWFNLPASVLVERYDRIIKAENEYIESTLGAGALKNGIRATTVFAADKGCAGYTPKDHWCWLQPESSLPVDTYGNITGGGGAGYGQWTAFRPRYLNSGLVVGPVGDLLALFRRTEDFIKALGIEEFVFWQSDQAIIIMAFAEQQLTRYRKARENPQWRAGDAPPPKNRTSPYGYVKGTNNIDLHPEFDELEYSEIELQAGEQFLRYEYGISIDYTSLLSHTTSSADHEWAYLRYGNGATKGVPKLDDPRDCRVTVRDSLPADLAAVPVPFPDIVGNHTHNVTWSDLKLYTNLCSGEIPAVIHHNGDKSMREAQWPSLWFTGHGFELLDAARNYSDAHPELNLSNGDAISDKGEPQRWRDICWVDEKSMFVEELVQYAPGATTYGVPPKFFPGGRALSYDI